MISSNLNTVKYTAAVVKKMNKFVILAFLGLTLSQVFCSPTFDAAADTSKGSDIVDPTTESAKAAKEDKHISPQL